MYPKPYTLHLPALCVDHIAFKTVSCPLVGKMQFVCMLCMHHCRNLDIEVYAGLFSRSHCMCSLALSCNRLCRPLSVSRSAVRWLNDLI